MPWGVTSSSTAFQWPEVAPEAKVSPWGDLYRQPTFPAGHYRRTSEQIGAMQTNATLTMPAGAKMSRSPTMTRVRYLDAPMQSLDVDSNVIMRNASRSTYKLVPAEEEIYRRAELDFLTKMYGTSQVAAQHTAASSAFAAHSFNASQSRQTAMKTTNASVQKPMPSAALGQQMVRTFTHSKMLSSSTSDRLSSMPLRTQLPDEVDLAAASHRSRYWRLRDPDGTSRVLDTGKGLAAPPPDPAVPTLLRFPKTGRFVRKPKSAYASDFTHAALGSIH